MSYANATLTIGGTPVEFTSFNIDEPPEPSEPQDVPTSYECSFTMTYRKAARMLRVLWPEGQRARRRRARVARTRRLGSHARWAREAAQGYPVTVERVPPFGQP